MKPNIQKALALMDEAKTKLQAAMDAFGDGSEGAESMDALIDDLNDTVEDIMLDAEEETDESDLEEV